MLQRPKTCGNRTGPVFGHMSVRGSRLIDGGPRCLIASTPPHDVLCSGLYVPWPSSQTIWDHHPDDHFRQLCGLSCLHPLPWGWLERHQLQPGEYSPTPKTFFLLLRMCCLGSCVLRYALDRRHTLIFFVLVTRHNWVTWQICTFPADSMEGVICCHMARAGEATWHCDCWLMKVKDGKVGMEKRLKGKERNNNSTEGKQRVVDDDKPWPWAFQLYQIKACEFFLIKGQEASSFGYQEMAGLFWCRNSELLQQTDWICFHLKHFLGFIIWGAHVLQHEDICCLKTLILAIAPCQVSNFFNLAAHLGVRLSVKQYVSLS